MRPPRWLLFGLAMSSLVLLTYAGVLLAFSIDVTEGIAAENPSLPAGHRAIVVPLGDVDEVPTRAKNATAPALLATGRAGGTLPNSATQTRVGQAVAHVPAGTNGTLEVDNATLDLAVLSGGAEGWILRPEAGGEAWFSASGDTLGSIARVESPAGIAFMFGLGGLGFVAPLLLVVITHRATRGERMGAPMQVCRECRAPMQAGAEFCMRCGAWTKQEASA